MIISLRFINLVNLHYNFENKNSACFFSFFIVLAYNLQFAVL